MSRPYIICHMLTSIDGKVTGEYLNKEHCQLGISKYYEIHRSFNADGFICGRVTMEGSFTNNQRIDLENYSNEEISREDFICNIKDKYAISFDRLGRVGWTNSYIIDEDEGYNNHYIIEVLTEKVQNNYLRYLQDIKVNYIFAGKEELDINLALKKLKENFNIKFLLLEGGSIINGAFFNTDVIDELSLVMVPIVADTTDKSLFYSSYIQNYKLSECTKMDDNVYLRYIKLEK